MSSDQDGPSHYEVLGVARAADDKAVRVAYSSAIWAARAEDDEERERAVQRARAVLGDPERRAAYDATLPPVEEPVRQPPGDPALASLLAMLAETGRLPETEDSGDEEPEIADEPPSQAGPPADADDLTTEEGEEDADDEDGRDEHESEEPAADRPAAVGPSTSPRSPVPDPVLGWAEPVPAGPVRPRRGRRVAVIALALSAIAGATLGWLYLRGQQPELVLEEGACVTLSDTDATAVSCTDDRADARIQTVTDDPQVCEGDAGHVELDAGPIGCLTFIEASPTTDEG